MSGTPSSSNPSVRMENDPYDTNWTRTHDLLFKNWMKQIYINIIEYTKRGRRKRHIHYAFGIFFALTQTGAIVTLINVIINQYTAQDGDCPSTPAGQLIFITTMEALVLVVGGLEKLFDPNSKSKDYFDAAKDFLALRRLIETTLVTPYRDRDSPRETIVLLRGEFNKIQDEAPTLPADTIVQSLELFIYQDPQQARGQGALEFDSPPPENTTPVDVPDDSPEEEYVSHSHRCRFEGKMREQRYSVKKGRKLDPNFEYQWRRMQQHDDEHRETLQENGKDEADMV